ncbi:MAG: type I secretion system permease/ATPase, partial [Proteobacteria bacterium]|nr:type I secretion system permease/ATPase [Pseudomonadota bacterium]
PLYMLQIFDRVLSSRSTDTLVLLTLIAVVALLVHAILESVRGQVMIRIGAWLDRKLGGTILASSVSQSLGSAREPSVQGLRDLSTFRTFLTGPAIFPLLDSPWTPIFVAIIFFLHPMLGWLSAAGAIVLFGLAVANDLAARKLLARAGGVSIKALNQAEALVRNADAIEAMGMMPNLVGRWNRDNSEMLALQGRASTLSGRITAASKFVRLLLQIGMLATGAWFVLAGEITPGVMIAGSILMARALAPVEQAIGSWRTMISARGAYDRIKRQLAAAPRSGAAMALPEPEGRLTVEGMMYSHPGSAEPMLRGISFALEPGETLGLIGPSASGKTTLARLLVGNLKPRLGHVRLDGVEISGWESESRGRHIGYLPQDVELFSGSVKENIARMGDPAAEAVVEAARTAGVHDLVLRLPSGYDTEIGEAGAVLSGGERQRIAFARAIYNNPKFVILDEPNASLDHAGEEALLTAIDKLRAQGVTLIVIAHRPSILRHVDKVLVLNEGAIQTFGPRDEVVPQVTGPERPSADPAPQGKAQQSHG